MFKDVSYSILSVLCVLFLASCGGGGGGGDSGSGNPPPNPGGGSINPQLEGSLFFVDGDNAYLMDIESGRYQQIPNTDWEEQDERYPLGIVSFSAKPSYYGGELIAITASECKPLEDSFGHISCIALQDFAGNYIADFDVLYDALGGDNRKEAAEISRDHNYLAFTRRPGATSATPTQFEVYDRSGELISSNEVEPDSFEWLPDGRIVFSADRGFFFTNPYSTEVDTVISLPDAIGEGEIDYLAASPNGEYVAFSLVTDGTLVSVDGSLWVLEVETRRIYKVADVAGRDAMIRNPRWSPDGEWIGVLEGGSSGTGIFNPGAPSDFYVIPFDPDTPDIYMLSRDVSARSSEVHRLQRYNNFDMVELTPDFPDWDFYWVP